MKGRSWREENASKKTNENAIMPSRVGWTIDEPSARQYTDSSQWKAACLLTAGQLPIIAVRIARDATAKRNGQWFPSHVVLPDAFREKNRQFTAPEQKYTGPAIYVFHGDVRQLATSAGYMLKDVLFAAVVDLVHKGNTVDGRIEIPTRDDRFRCVEFTGAVKVESNDPAAWPPEIKDHEDIKSRYIDNFLLGTRISIIAHESIKPSDQLVCAAPPPQQVQVQVLRTLKDLWSVVVALLAKKEDEEANLRRRQRGT